MTYQKRKNVVFRFCIGKFEAELAPIRRVLIMAGAEANKKY
jgi:hypothetical protein